MTISFRCSFLLTCILALASSTGAQTLGFAYTADYDVVDLGSVPGLPANLGAVVFKAGDPSTLLIAAGAESASGAVYEVGVTRDSFGHVNGFAGPAALAFAAPDISSGLSYASNGTLLFTTVTNAVGQVLPGSSSVDKLVSLSIWGVLYPMGGGQFVPSGIPGAGKFKVMATGSAASSSSWYNVTWSVDPAGTFSVSGLTFVTSAFPFNSAAQGFDFIGAPRPAFPGDSVLVSENGIGTVSAYLLGGINFEPAGSTRQEFLQLDGVYGAVRDPQTSDLLFTTFGSGDRVVLVRSFDVPHAYCAGKLASTGCQPTVQFAGSPTLSGPDDFALTCTAAPNNVAGILVWSTVLGSQPFHNSILCLGAPLSRTPVQVSGGNPGKATDCSGTFTNDLSQAFFSAQGLPPGSSVYCQYYGRDPGFAWPDSFMTSEALSFTILP